MSEPNLPGSVTTMEPIAHLEGASSLGDKARIKEYLLAIDPLRPPADPLRPPADPLRPSTDPLRPSTDPLRPPSDPLRSKANVNNTRPR